MQTDGQPLAVHLRVPAAQLIGLGVTQLPLPLQVGAAVNWEELAGQEALPQLVPLARCWQPLAPLQRPVLPQVEADRALAGRRRLARTRSARRCRWR